eukprot:GGOE01018848.1.p1 GENE.GGOE01018848.1~~GGOE01018848.1.p1  ORF type:complete len:252 (-),score=107.39 GGOE01018848.1:287-1042(-)
MPFYTKVQTETQLGQRDEGIVSDDEAEEVGEESDFEDYEVPKEKTGDVSAVKRLLDEEDAKEWIEKFHVFSNRPVEADVNDDTKRELAFETSALQSVAAAVETFKKIKYQYRRPDDYFVEMQKTDNHMYKVREVLEKQRKQVLEKEERRKRKYMQKVGKHTEAQIMQERQKKKKEMMHKVEEFKKKRKHGVEEEFEMSDDEGAKPAKRGKKGSHPARPKGSKKRRPNPSGKKSKGAKTKRHGKAKRKGGKH